MQKPIHTGNINGKPVRFFATPLNDGLPDFPWHSTNDLMSACNLDGTARQHFMRMAQRDHVGTMQTIATPDGVVTVAPHYHAQGFVDAMVHVKRVKKRARADYDMAIMEAGKALFPMGMSFEYMIAAFHRWSDTKPAVAGE
ncbi:MULTISPECIES: hypothetical protein [Azospirillum]|nr:MULTISPECIES: hypothetical protein [Azospirillum]MDW7555372.1 hypothetical protein [Azospirillum brasilense]MDW7595220.1 hypothetical protein [Azospirillum brasilense]MDW7630373.1 hypothetical protein [Azospirillum brasilense]MDX5949741.1 hypothetical protein [Azospirillum brasilense]